MYDGHSKIRGLFVITNLLDIIWAVPSKKGPYLVDNILQCHNVKTWRNFLHICKNLRHDHQLEDLVIFYDWQNYFLTMMNISYNYEGLFSTNHTWPLKHLRALFARNGSYVDFDSINWIEYCLFFHYKANKL
jgi:hypothetical protein